MTLCRHVINRKLAQYFSQPHQTVVGHTKDPINFKWIFGQRHFYRILSNLYNDDSRTFQWLTPVELFRPHYSNIIADFVAREFKKSGKDGLRLVELGAGRGTNARLILERLSQEHPDIYSALTDFTLVDASPSLGSLQRNVVSLSSADHSSKVKYIQHNLGDDMDCLSFLSHSLSNSGSIQTFALAFELLDNLPHDKVMRDSDGTLLQGEVFESETDGVISDERIEQMEKFAPLLDPLLQNIVNNVPAYVPRRGAKWVPSVACHLIQQLYEQNPDSYLLLADFDWLPPPSNFKDDDDAVKIRSSDAEGDPLVTSMDGVDYECYLSAPPYCDILFPTNFRLLAQFTESCCGHGLNVQVKKQRDFMIEFGGGEIQRTSSFLGGYSPLVDEFGNCSILTVTR